MKDRLNSSLRELMLIAGSSGHEGRVRRYLAERLRELGIAARTDRFGNLVATLEGTRDAPSVMLFAHMDQVGFVVRRIEPDGFLRVERVGGIPEKVLPAAPVLICAGEGRDRIGIFGSKSNHVTPESEKYKVQPYLELFIDAGFASAREVEAAGIDVGTPVVYRPQALSLGEDRVAGTSIDDRAACAVILEVARGLLQSKQKPKTHLVFSVQEEFNVRGAMVAAQTLLPDIAIQLDVALSSDTSDLAEQGHVRLGGGPAMSLYNFHGRGTLNGTIAHPALVALFAGTAKAESIALQRIAVVGVLTDGAYVQFAGKGVAAIDLGFPMRYAHSPCEVCDLGDLVGLTRLVLGGLARIGPGFDLDRDSFIS
ncbi:MAG: M42 family metallopeptidase [Hyphomicrobiales bacterium]